MKHIWIGALLALSAWTGAARAQAITVEVGGKPIAIASPGPLERASEAAPTLFTLYQAGLPTTHRLVEAFITPGDLERTLTGQPVDDVSYQVQVMRNVEHVDLGEADWRTLRPQIIREVASLDATTLIDGQESAASQRISDAAGVAVDLAFGEIGKLQPYGDDSGSVRFHVLLPVSVEVAGVRRTIELQSAGAALPLGGRLLFLYAFRRHRAGEDARVVRAALDHWVEATVAANRR
ncbi:hypothetical protein [Lysobacter humi (ex Lee et al. 2017)]